MCVCLGFFVCLWFVFLFAYLVFVFNPAIRDFFLWWRQQCELLFPHMPCKWKFFAIWILPFVKSSLCNLWCFLLSQVISIKLYLSRSLSLSSIRAGKTEIVFRWEKGLSCWTWVKDFGFPAAKEKKRLGESDCHCWKGLFLFLGCRDFCTCFIES